MGSTPDGRHDQLVGWKEIAGYLGVKERTAQRWEVENGLPVLRLEGARGRVTADPPALDRWRQTALARRSWWTSLRFLQVYGMVTTGILALTAVGLGAWYFFTIRPGPPVAYRIEDRNLIVRDKADREVFRYAFDHPLRPDFYDSPEGPMRAWFGHLNGDGSTETVFSYHPGPRTTKPQSLHCFSQRGRLLWSYTPGRRVSDAVREYLPPYHLRCFRIVPITGGKNVAVSFVHNYSYPCQVALLDPSGRLAGEYWHSGHLDVMDVADLDSDGVPEIYLAGVNEGYRQATLVVLDPRRIAGASAEPEGSPQQLRGFARGTEKAVVLFPRTLLNRKFEPFNFAYDVEIVNDSVKIQVKEQLKRPAAFVIYTLDRNLTVTSVDVSDSMQTTYREMKASGQLERVFSDQDREELRRGVQVIRP